MSEEQGAIPQLNRTRAPAMAWSQQVAGNDRITWAPNSESIGSEVRWAPTRPLRDGRATSSVPSISGNQSPTCMVWKGVAGDTRIWYSLWDAAANDWGDQIPSNFKTEQYPTVVNFKGHTLMFWNDPDSRHHIAWSELVNGRWVHPMTPGDEPKAQLGFQYVTGISAAWDTHQDGLYIACRGVKSDDADDTGIYWLQGDDHTTSGQFLWQESGQIPFAAARTQPALVSDGNVLHAAWHNANDDHISWAWSVNGGVWTRPLSLTDRLTSATPALAAISTGDVIMAWKGAGADPRIWWSRLRNNAWGPQTPFPDRQLNADRALALWAPAL
ncbi:hypothetical protein [Actinomadura rupiterrae]|uniref:hypothetical protein n=1 Tax=Actinomadura rupiterrae TaxID=559627 RepID=UPI0020A2ECC0|nr:hypothetical protein [Actinomadura rupiterrae]MCP2336435.1 hypothetical protein [Actinomadura rupiterrae]